MKRIAISVDFDFFVREKSEWEFGHSESNLIYNFSAWQARYLHLELEKECDISKHADFDPLNLMIELENKNLIFAPDFPLGIADSHLFAHDWFKKFEVDQIIHLDAHSDCYPLDPKKHVLDCGNWLTDFSTKTTWVFPQWKNPEDDHAPARVIEIKSWKEFEMKESGVVVCAFLCRSAAWVPPHLDIKFGELVALLAEFSSPIQLQAIPIRPDINLNAIKRFRGELRKWQEDAMSDELKKKESSNPNESSEDD
jgi:hypothetical protein